MFHKFTIVFLLLATFALAQSASPVARKYGNDFKTVRGIIFDKIKQALQKLFNNISTLIEKAVLRLFGLDLTPVQDALISQLNKAVDGSLSTIEDIQTLGIKTRMDLTSCIKGSKEEIKQLGLDFVKDLLNCGVEQIKAAEKIIKDTVDAVKNTINRVPQLNSDFSACSKIVCYLKVSAKIGLSLLKLPINISNEVIAAKDWVTSLKTELTECGMKVLTTALSQINAIVQSVSSCANSRMKMQHARFMPKFIK